MSLSNKKQNLIIVGNASFFAGLKLTPAPILKELAKYCAKNKLIRYPESDNDVIDD